MWVKIPTKVEVPTFDDEALLLKGDPISVEEYGSDNPVYWPNTVGAELVYANVRSLLDHCKSRSIPIPTRVFACKRREFLFDVHEVLAFGLRCESWEDIEALVDREAVEKLQELLDTWCMGISLNAFDVDYDQVVCLTTLPS